MVSGTPRPFRKLRSSQTQIPLKISINNILMYLCIPCGGRSNPSNRGYKRFVRQNTSSRSRSRSHSRYRSRSTKSSHSESPNYFLNCSQPNCTKSRNHLMSQSCLFHRCIRCPYPRERGLYCKRCENKIIS